MVAIVPSNVTSIDTDAFGYYYDDWRGRRVLNGFVLYGYVGTAAERYANKNDIVFIPLDSVEHICPFPIYYWSDDNSICTATAQCLLHNDETVEEIVGTASIISVEPGCYNSGIETYTASFENCLFETQTKDVTIDAVGHNWALPTYTWSSDNSKCTATRVCSRDSSHKETETVNTTSVTTESTYEKTGKIVYTAKFTNSAFATQTKTVTLPVKTFPDVKSSDWFYTAVQYNAERGFITGFKDGTFGPNKQLTRQDFVVILARIAGADLTSYENVQSTMPDVIKGSYYAAAVNWAVDNGIIGGYTGGAKAGKFGVGDPITREQVCVILYRYMGSPAITGADNTLKPFADAGKISSFAKNAVVWAIQNGVISGKKPDTLAPTVTASRAEIATIVMRMDKAGMFNE